MAFEFNITESKHVRGVLEVEASSFVDHRGSIWTSYDKAVASKILPDEIEFCHDKFVQNKKNVLRGLHGDYKTFKFVMCPVGAVFQVAVDVRKNSPTYSAVHSTLLNEDNKKSLLLPPGVANGFVVLSNQALYHYKLAYEGNYIDDNEQFTIRFDDPRFNIIWPTNSLILSDRDNMKKF